MNALLDWTTWYGRRPWHMLFGHDRECVEFLDAEREHPAESYPVYDHDCCKCGLAIKPRRGGCPRCHSPNVEPVDYDATAGQCNDCGHEWPNEDQPDYSAGAHCVGDFDGCPSCFGCPSCNYDCCSDCTFEHEFHSTWDATKQEGTAGIHYWNQVCNCEGHNCGVAE